MKKQMIFGKLLAFAGIANAQWDNPTSVAITPGNIGIGTAVAPAYKLDISTNTQEDGIRITQTNHAGALIDLNNATFGGHMWRLISTGAGNSAGSGHFGIYDQTTSGGPNRFFISGSTGNVGIGTTSPSYKLEIATSNTSPDGLKITQSNTGICALSLNNTNGSGAEWRMFSDNLGNYVIEDKSLGIERMRIRTSGRTGMGTTVPYARLHVIGDSIGVFGDATTTYGAIGVKGVGYGNSSVAGSSYGVYGIADGGLNNCGGWFDGTGSSSAGHTAFGVVGRVYGSGGGSVNYGVYGVGNGNHAGLGPDWAGYFQGDVFSTTAFTPSDKNLKKNIRTMNNSLSIIKKLNPVSYNFDCEAHLKMSLPAAKQYGFISQEIAEILPKLTKVTFQPGEYDNKGNEIAPGEKLLALNYNGFIAILTNGIQEQQSQIESQQKTNDTQTQIINDLQKQLDEQKQLIGSMKNSGATGINFPGAVETGFQMSQNEPNPFTHETVIKYTMPQTISSAFMAVYDLTGKQITTFPIMEKGSSSLTIISEKLSAGIYIYSIVADGKVIDSKRMIVADK